MWGMPDAATKNAMIAQMMSMMGKGGGGAWGGGGGGAAAWGGGGGASGGTPTIKWLSLEGKESNIISEGFAPDAPALEYWKQCDIFSEGHHILQEFCDGDISAFVTLEHDPDCSIYPEVYAAWKEQGEGDNLPTVAKCPTIGKWAVGLGGKKNAERAAKLAISLCIAADSPLEKVEAVCCNYPDFRSMCQEMGIAVQSASKKAKRGGGSAVAWSGGGQESKAKIGGLPEIKTLSLEGKDSTILSEGFAPDAPALVYWKECEIFSSGHHILQDFFDGDMSNHVTLEHDYECSIYPEVYEAWKEQGGEDNIPTVAKCPALSKWAVGFGGKKNAERAAKLALALSIAADAPPEKLAFVYGSYPLFREMCTLVGAADPEAADADVGALMTQMSSGLGAGKGGMSGKGGKGGGKGGKMLGAKSYPAENKVWIGGLGEDVTVDALKEHFGICGTIEVATLMKKGTACIAFSTAEEATLAITMMTGMDLNGSILEVDVWTAK